MRNATNNNCMIKREMNTYNFRIVTKRQNQTFVEIDIERVVEIKATGDITC